MSDPTADAGSGEDDGAEFDEVDGGRAQGVLTYLAAQLVEDPDAVHVEAEEGRGSATKLSLTVGPGDMGKVIGRRGRTAQAIRAVVRAAAASEGRDVVVDIVD